MQVDLARAAPALATTEPIVAWRSWALTGRPDASRLRLRPVAGPRLPWPYREPARAHCKKGRLHAAPALGCTCGLHATHTTELLRRTKAPAVLGRIALWGTIVEHEHGYRAEFAYPQRLRLVCLLCFWLRGTFGEDPDVVAIVGRRRMLPLCEPHLGTAVRYGMQPRVTVDAGTIERALLDAYAVDLLREPVA
ncbi:MAG: hypothetical protein WD556_06590 [Actinomycetota bacterium]